MVDKFRGGLGPTAPHVSLIIDIMAQHGVRAQPARVPTLRARVPSLWQL